jgi:hypothetical protein
MTKKRNCKVLPTKLQIYSIFLFLILNLLINNSDFDEHKIEAELEAEEKAKQAQQRPKTHVQKRIIHQSNLQMPRQASSIFLYKNLK